MPIEIKQNIIEFKDYSENNSNCDMLGFSANPIKTVRIGFIGLGKRGMVALDRYTHIEGVEIKAICDSLESKTLEASKKLKNSNINSFSTYFGKNSWKLICERNDIDLVYICTQWQLHTPMATYAMQHNKHVAVEVPAATSIKECWQLVDTSEKTKRHCIMLENCIYDIFELTTKNMADNNLFGELVHAEGAYIHDLKEINFDIENGCNDLYRLEYSKFHTGNPYPTHGLGPIAHTMKIHRGDKMKTLISMSSNQFGLTAFAKEKFGKDSELAKVNYELGDMNTTIIKTELGKTIMIQHDVTSPRPYDRRHAISGTLGYGVKYPKQNFYFAPNAPISSKYKINNFTDFIDKETFDKIIKDFQHPIIKNIKHDAEKLGAEFNMNYIMDYRLIYCLRNGLPLDMDVYDAAEWSAIGELSEVAIRNNYMPVKIPDFTRGKWKKFNKVTYQE